MLTRAAILFVLHLLAILFMAFSYSRVAVSGEWSLMTSGEEAGTLPPNAAPDTIGHSTKRFHRPVYHGARLDWCAGPGSAGCGQEAAVAFCKALGYGRPVSIVQEREIAPNEQTVQIGSSARCAGGACSSFMSITCTAKAS